MHASSQKHTVAVLRGIIGLTQQGMADLVDRSTITIQKIEIGKLPLSGGLGLAISQQTGVALEWLMANNISAPPVTESGKEFTKAVFEERQAWLKRTLRAKEADPDWVSDTFASIIATFVATASSALRQHRFPLFAYKMAAAQEKLAEAFGTDAGYRSAMPEGQRDNIHYAMQKLFDLIQSQRQQSKPQA
jgi:hypothetical protein